MTLTCCCYLLPQNGTTLNWTVGLFENKPCLWRHSPRHQWSPQRAHRQPSTSWHAFSKPMLSQHPLNLTGVSLIYRPKAQSLHPNQTQIYDNSFKKSIQDLGKSSEIYSKLAALKQPSQLAWDRKHSQKCYRPLVQQKAQPRVATKLIVLGNTAKVWKGINRHNRHNHTELGHQ